MKTNQMSKELLSYIETALWSSISDDSQPLADCDITDFAPVTVAQCKDDLTFFWTKSQVSWMAWILTNVSLRTTFGLHATVTAQAFGTATTPRISASA